MQNYARFLNKQNSFLKYLVIIFILCGCLIQPIYSQGNIITVSAVDSLFRQKQYTLALQHYENILEKDQLYSPSMLLKMAFIKEGLGDYTGAMYYLHLYYSKTPNRTVLRKMEDLAQTHQLSGYEYSDLQFFKTQFQKYYLVILEGMLLGAVVVLTVLAVNRKTIFIGNSFKIAYVLYLVFILYYINYLDLGREGIIRQNRIPIMSAPSAGASWIATASQGHKLKLRGEQDIWYEVEWKNRRAYIRKQNILLLP
jgi:tetratricopeptide (TPR) repeat protein